VCKIVNAGRSDAAILACSMLIVCQAE